MDAQVTYTIRWSRIKTHFLSCHTYNCNTNSTKQVRKGCRQGCPLSPYLFILCVEILAIKLRQETKIKGFKFGNDEHKLDMYADDLTLYFDMTDLVNKSDQLRWSLEILNNFYLTSGLKINTSKCKCTWFGTSSSSKEVLCPDLGLEWDNTFTILGIDFDSGLENMNRNFDAKLKEIKNSMQAGSTETSAHWEKSLLSRALPSPN